MSGRETGDAADENSPRRTRRAGGPTRVSPDCPRCGGTAYTKVRSSKLVAFAADRECKACGTRYTPPTPSWAAVLFILFGGILVLVAASLVVLQLVRGNLINVQAMICEGFTGVVGAAAVVQGVRALIWPGEV